MLNDTTILNRVTDDYLMKQNPSGNNFPPTVTEKRGINYSMNQADTLNYGKDFGHRKMFIEKPKYELFDLMTLSQKSQTALRKVKCLFPSQQLVAKLPELRTFLTMEVHCSPNKMILGLHRWQKSREVQNKNIEVSEVQSFNCCFASLQNTLDI